MRPGLIDEVSLIPDRPFVKEERLALGIPVAGNFQLWRFAVVVLSRKRIIGLGLAIEKPAVGLFLMMEAEEAGEIGIDNGGPFAVERKGRPAVGGGERHGRVGSAAGAWLRASLGSDIKTRQGNQRQTDIAKRRGGHGSISCAVRCRWLAAFILARRPPIQP